MGQVALDVNRRIVPSMSGRSGQRQRARSCVSDIVRCSRTAVAVASCAAVLSWRPRGVKELAMTLWIASSANGVSGWANA